MLVYRRLKYAIYRLRYAANKSGVHFMTSRAGMCRVGTKVLNKCEAKCLMRLSSRHDR